MSSNSASHSLAVRIWFAVRIVLVRLRFVVLPLAAFLLVAVWPTLSAYVQRLTAQKPSGAGAVSVNTEYFCPMCPGVLSDWPSKCPVCNMALVRRKRGEAVPLPDGVMARMQLSPYRVQLAGIQTSPVAYRPLVRQTVLTGVVEKSDPKGSPWIDAEVFEKDVPFLTEGRTAEAAADALPGRSPFSARVGPLSPHRAGELRSFRVRIDLDDPRQELRPGMPVMVRAATPVQQTEPFRSLPTGPPALKPGEVRQVYVCPRHPETPSEKPGRCPVDDIELEARPLAENQRLGWGCPRHVHVFADHADRCPECQGKKLEPRVLTFQPPGEVLAVPESAVIDTGTRKVVYLERMPGMFDGVEVVLGLRCGDHYPVVSGLVAGERVATAGAFLIDAEAKLNPSLAATYFGAGRGGEGRPEASPGGGGDAAITQALARLPTEDRALARKQKVCPVTGEPLGSMGMPVSLTVEGRKVFLCCKGCESAVRKEPAKYLSKIDGK